MFSAVLEEEGNKLDAKDIAWQKKHGKNAKKKKIKAKKIQVGPQGPVVERLEDRRALRGIRRSLIVLFVIGLGQLIVGLILFLKSDAAGHVIRVGMRQGAWWNGLFAMLTAFQGCIALYMNGDKNAGLRYLYMNCTFVFVSGAVGCYGDCQWPNNSNLMLYTQLSCGFTAAVALAHAYALFWASAWTNSTLLRQYELPGYSGSKEKGHHKREKHKHEYQPRQKNKDKNDFALQMLNGETPGKKQQRKQKKKIVPAS